MPLKKNYSSFVVLYMNLEVYTYESAEVRNALREQSRTVVIGARKEFHFSFFGLLLAVLGT